MNKALRFGIAGLLLLGGVVWYAQSDREASSGANSGNPETSTEPRSANQPSTGTQSTSSGQYLTYAGDLSIGSGRRLLFFHAPWCPQCRALEKSIQAEGVPEGVTIIKVDYDSNQKLRQEYGVTIQTTLVEIDASSGLVERYVAYEEPSLAAVSSHFKFE